MMTRFLTFAGAFTLLFLFGIIFYTCSKDSTDPENNPDPIDLTGSWSLTTTITSNTCGLPNGETNTETLLLTDTSGVPTIINFDGNWGQYSVSGSTLQFTGSEETDRLGCLATLTTAGSGTGTITEISGTFTTTVDFDPSCSGYSDCQLSSDFVMTKLAESPCLGRANFGDPANSDYILPFPVGAEYPVYQSYCWQTGGHRDQLAYDFTMPIGDTVIAARDGVVREVKEDSPDDGQGLNQHNRIYIQHSDGSLASYAHLKQYGVEVEVGDTVTTGQFIALSGNSGQIDEPHLHIGIYEDYPPAEGVDIAFNFRNAQGPLDSRGGLLRGVIYKALPY
jgi:hypothetical protein